MISYNLMSSLNETTDRSFQLNQRGFDVGRVQYCVMCLPKYWPPPPPSPPGEFILHPQQRRGGEGGGGSIIWMTHDIGLASYSNNHFTPTVNNCGKGIFAATLIHCTILCLAKKISLVPLKLNI